MAEKLVEFKEKAFAQAVDNLQTEIRSPNVDPATVASLAKAIATKSESLAEALQKLGDELIRLDNVDKYLEVEEKLTKLQIDVDSADQISFEFLKVNAPAASLTSAPDCKVQLPQLKLQEFAGDVRSWLSFWSGFEEIDQNVNIKDTDKYQYLLQCIPASSAARKCIDSFPVCGKNYKNAVETLKNTFGREKMLVKVYVRDLLQLVIRNANQKSVDLVELVPQLASQIRNLEELGVTSDKCEDILYPVVESCLPDEVLQAWQRTPGYQEKLDGIMKFLNSEVQQQMERCLARMDFVSSSSTSVKKNKQAPVIPTDVPTATALMNVSGAGKGKQKCAFCEDSRHKSQKCFKAKKMTLKEKEDKLRAKRMCFICFRGGHFAGECEANIPCRNCNGNHYEIMCREMSRHDGRRSQQDFRDNQPRHPCQTQRVTQNQPEGKIGFMVQQTPQWNFQSQQQYLQPQQQPQLPLSSWSSANQWDSGIQQQIQQRNDEPKTKTQMVNGSGRTSVTLKTLVVEVDTISGPCLARVFIDGGSEESYIQESLCSFVKHQRVGSITSQHQLFGGYVTEEKHHEQCLITLRNVDRSREGTFVFNTIPKIAQKIPRPSNKFLQELAKKGVNLHNQSIFNDEVHLMIGTDVAEQIWTGGFVRINQFATAKETIFGWVASGAQEDPETMEPSQSHLVTSFMVSQLNEEELWSLEALGITDEARSQTRKDLEQAAVAHFERTVSRQPDGRYEVSLPWLEGHKDLQCNREQAVMRLKSLTNKLKKEGYLGAYNDIFNQWLEDGVIERVTGGSSRKLNYYMPHRHVIKEGSTTPVRPVFDASAKCKGGVSLNDCLEKGPNMLERIPAVMARFRMQRIGVIADIKKAFLQMSVAERDRDALQFVWWNNEECKDLVTYRHARVVFGVTSSPFLLAVTLQHHLRNYGDKYPDVAVKLLQSLYVDNSIVSCDSMEEAELFQQKSQELLIGAQFDLRGWEFGPTTEEKIVPVLGMNWNVKTDTLSLCLENSLKKLELPSTKRGLLAAVNTIFDLMGFVSPFTLIPKILFQRCCEASVNWDDPLPEDINKVFDSWKRDVPVLKKVEVPRWMCASADVASRSLHTFSDASGFAFACCTYMRTVSSSGATNVQLVMSKSRVAPSKKKMTIPRLELMGCLIGVRVARELKKYLQMEDIPCYYWTDSSTALAWISNEKKWARFVEGRVDEIRKFTRREEWRHVPGEYNPADRPSRGCSAEQLVQLQWWEGPDWLRQPEDKWPKSAVRFDEEVILQEVCKTVVSVHTRPQKEVLDCLRKFSNFNKSLRVTGVVLRYMEKLRERVIRRRSGKAVKRLQLQQDCGAVLLSALEIEKAEIVVLRYIQRTSFKGISDPHLKDLSCFVDMEGIIRVRSQLLYGNDSYGVRCPALLPNKHVIVTAIIHTEHVRNSHAGVQTMMAILREKYWVIKARRTISGIISACGGCRRFVAKRCEVPSAPLPKDRINDTRAFDTTGVDLLGPLYLRGREKIWVVLYTCAVFRCVHLEVTSTLSTEGFLKTFRRFVNRRGRPSKVYSDNGLNFVGCHNLFKQLEWSDVQRYAAVERIQWTFNPPTAAWWGGWWERLVGLVKTLLRRVLGKSVVSMEEFTTILTDVESTLNQRPLGYVSDAKEYLVPLCPAMFLNGYIPGGLPEADVVDNSALNQCVRRVQYLREELRLRFRKEYLGQLKLVASNKEKTVAPGDVVIVEVDDKKKIEWPLGVIQDVYPGRDGKVRTALVKVKTGSYLRPVQRLFIMETAMSNVEKEGDADLEEVATKEVVTRSGRQIKKPNRLSYE